MGRTVDRLRIALAAAAAVWIVVHTALALQREQVVSLSVSGRSSSTPWVAAAGTDVAVAWGASAEGRTDVFVAVSQDAGRTFGTPVRVNAAAGEARLGGEFPPRVALVSRGGTSAPEVVVLWTAREDVTGIKTARSRDGGRTFDTPLTLQTAGTPGNRGWPSLALDARGVAHAIWLDHRGHAAEAGAGHQGHGGDAALDGVASAARSSLFYATSGARGRELEVTNGVCYCCKTALAIGPDGAVYAAWRHVYPGNLRDIAFSMSRNGGSSFSSPVRVSRDGWAINGCPEDGPAMAVDREGTIHLVWPTVVGGATPRGALFYASTRDGRTFTPRTRIPTLESPKPSHPQIAIDPAGRIAVAWDEVIAGRRVAVLRELRTAPGRQPGFGSIVTLSPDEPAMHPVLAATDNGLVAVWTTAGEESGVRAKSIRLP